MRPRKLSFAIALISIATALGMSSIALAQLPRPRASTPPTPRPLPDDYVGCEKLPACPGGLKEINLCVIDPDVKTTRWNLFTRLNEYNNCGADARRVTINDISKLEDEFRNSLRSCERIKILRLNGHGAPGVTAAGGLETSRLHRLKHLNCVMAEDATIDLLGCNTGRGCLGQLFMYKVAESLLPKSGEVIGTTFYATVILPYIKHVSLDGTRRVLRIDRTKRPEEQWLLDTPVRRYQTQASDSCISEIDQTLELMKEHERWSKSTNTCVIPDNAPIRQTALTMRERKADLQKLDRESMSFEPISRITGGWWYQGKVGGFTGISNSALALLEEIQPYLSCRRQQLNGRSTKPYAPSGVAK